MVHMCKEVSSLMGIIGRNSLALSSKQHMVELAAAKEFRELVDKDFGTLVENLVCKPADHEMLKEQVINVIYTLIEESCRTNVLPVSVTSPASAADQATRAAQKRERLILDIEEQCPSIFNPVERSKIKAEKCLVEAKEAMARGDLNRVQASLREAKEHYDRVSRDINRDDLSRMIQSFCTLRQPLTAILILLKRFAEQVGEAVREQEADALQEVIEVCAVALLDDKAALSTVLHTCLEHKGLYKQALRGEGEEPAVFLVFRAVLAPLDPNRSLGYLWPLLRSLPLFRKNGSAEQLLVEYLRQEGLFEKLVELYNETGQFSRAGEVCLQQANTRATYPSSGSSDPCPTLDERIHWYRQAAKAAKLNGGALNNRTQASLLEQYADIAHIQKHLLEQMEERVQRRTHQRDTGELLQTERQMAKALRASLFSMQELFERSCEHSAWEVAMELCEVVASGGDVHSDALNLPEVVSKLWRLIVEQAWGEAESGGLVEAECAEQAWQRVEASVCGIGRRYARKASLLPLQQLAACLEDRAFHHFHARSPAWAEACRPDQDRHAFWTGHGASTLDAPAWRVPRLLLLGFGLGSLALVKAYQDLYEAIGDANRRVHCFRTIKMLYELYLREVRDTEEEAMVPFAAIENDFVRLEAKSGVPGGELRVARALLKDLRVRRQQSLG